MQYVSKLGLAGLTAAALALVSHHADARCIDPSDNSVDNAAHCLFVDKSEEDCRLGFAVDMDGTGTPPADPKKIECVDGDACDGDGAVNGVCEFRVGACVNVPTMNCAAAAGDGVAVTKPSLKDASDAIKRPDAVYNRRTIGEAIDALLPSAGEACTDPDLPVRVALKAKKGTCGSPSGQSCSSDHECDDYCLPSFSGNKALVAATLLMGDDSIDKAKFKLTCLPAAAGSQGAEAFQISNASDLIGGPLAMGKVGDWMIRNGNVRVVIRDVGREHSFSLLNGGQIIDADLTRDDPAEDRDSWQGIQPLIHVSSTQATDSIVVINDGSDGNPAIIESSGPDDLFDTIQPDVLVFSQAPLSVPQDAVDNNLPLQISTRFILSPYSNYVQMATTVENIGATDLELYVGDFINPSGQLEPFGPGQGYGETLIRNGGSSASRGQTLDFLAFQGQFDAAGVTYGLVFPSTSPGGGLLTRNTSAFSQSGVFAWLNNQNLFDTLFNDPDDKPPGTFEVPAGGENTLRRWFVIGETVADVTKVRTELFLQDKGAVQGTITVDGIPVAGAHVTLVNNDANYENACPTGDNCVNVFSSTLTDEAGFYRMYAPAGRYRVAVRSKGAPFEGNLAVPTEHAFDIEYKKTALLDVDLPGTATVSVSVTDQDSNPVPAKVSIVGVPAAPDPLNTEMTKGLVAMVGRYFGWPVEDKGDIFGLADVRFADASGSTGDFQLEPGTYQVVTSRGYEYDVDSQTLVVAAGDDVNVSAQVRRVIDTTGFVSIDTHVHMLNSPDSAVSRERRILTMIAEGVDFFANTDHDFVHELSDEIAAMGVGSLIANAPAQEITTSQYGHFNTWPMTVNPAEVDGGALDWGRAGEVNGAGYPSDGSYDLSPAEIFGSFNPATQVIQINHFNSGTLGHFNSLGIDTDAVPPTSATTAYRCVGGSFDGNPCEIRICLAGANDGNTCTGAGDCPGGTCSSPSFGRTCPSGTCMPAGHPNQYLRLDPAITNTFDDGFTALEVWIEAGRSQTDLLRSDNMSDWFNLLNQGIYKAGVADSDTHNSAAVQAGGPRTFVASPTDDPASIDATVLAGNVNGMRAIGTNGPFLEVTLKNNSGGTATHALGSSRTVEFDGGGTDSIDIHVESPTWAEYDRIEIYVNAVPSCKSQWTFMGVVNPSSCTVAPTMTLNKGTGFTVTTATGAFGVGQRLVTDVNVPLTVAADSWVVVVVRGTDGVSHPLFPMQPQDLDDAGNTTLAALTDNGGPLPWNLNELGALALAFSNPLFFDDGNGVCVGGGTCPGL
ncbi:MAG TPA: hypothetical protein VEC57_00655 [Candidatus Limnocylindrales bacterium]|nr:hypothetical protein [Candidatus Limnocylindrales bacterium]